MRQPRITIQNSRRTARARAHHSPVSDSLLVFCYRRGANRRAENIAVSRLHPPPASVAAGVCARDAQGRRPAQSPGRRNLRRRPDRLRRLRQFLRRPYHLAIAGRSLRFLRALHAQARHPLRLRRPYSLQPDHRCLVDAQLASRGRVRPRPLLRHFRQVRTDFAQPRRRGRRHCNQPRRPRARPVRGIHAHRRRRGRPETRHATRMGQ